MSRDTYDQMVFLRSDPTFQLYECANCKEEVYGDELDENEFCEECR
ncbi:hypothetical protein SAMN05192534_12321 [Alteribacillus persepolensis]|uniref:Uncharacterized protein n=1 Tax=Alteribacillus persepolensis TaxID=568899 RepID=A0A1G8I7C4_9BACI|nr:hypothetical protein [Alteribacillus persepolensis]SDI14732.1 hypothetical protein SAMN05192534_12321 [Alteribacillus persepolensis]